MRVLVADDHEVVRVGLKQILAGWTVIEASDGDSALKLYKKHKPDVTILDVRMPHDGLKCLAEIKLVCHDAPVLVMSGHQNPTFVARAAALGAQGFLDKSATSKEIVAAVNAVARSESVWTKELLRKVSGSLLASPNADVSLTKRECDVLKQVALGLSNKEIGLALGICYETVKEHVQHIFRKIGVTDRTQVAVWAVRNGLV